MRALSAHGRELRPPTPTRSRVVSVPAGTTADALHGSAASARRTSPQCTRCTSATRSRRAATDAPTIRTSQLPDQWYSDRRRVSVRVVVHERRGRDDRRHRHGRRPDQHDLLADRDLLARACSTARRSAYRDRSRTDTAPTSPAIARPRPTTASAFAGSRLSTRLRPSSSRSAIFDPATGFANGSDEAIAIGDAVAHGADVINLSLGAEEASTTTAIPTYAGGYDEGEYEAIQAALAADVTVVAAAGNNRDGSDGAGDHYKHVNLDYPAGYRGRDRGRRVAAQRRQHRQLQHARRSPSRRYSQTGDGLALVAPGGEPRQPRRPDADLLHWIWGYYSTTATQPCQYEQQHAAARFRPTAPRSSTARRRRRRKLAAAAALLYSAAGGHHVLAARAGQAAARAAPPTTSTIPTKATAGSTSTAPSRRWCRIPARRTAGRSRRRTPRPNDRLRVRQQRLNRPTILDYDYPVGVPVVRRRHVPHRRRPAGDAPRLQGRRLVRRQRRRRDRRRRLVGTLGRDVHDHRARARSARSSRPGRAAPTRCRN